MNESFYPRISIITPSFNQGAFLEETIKSVINQNYPNLEYIIIDGGSSDNSVEIIKKYKKYLSYWISEKDEGQSDAINKGFEKATGDILAWINSDDQYYPDVFNQIAHAFATNKVDLMYGYHNDVNTQGKTIRKGIFVPFNTYAFKIGFAICQPTSFWRKEVWETCGPLNKSLLFCMDYDFYCRVVKNKYIIKSFPTLICKFRYHTESKSMNFHSRFKDETIFLQKNYFPEIWSNPNSSFFAKCLYFILIGSRRIIRTFKIF